MRYITNITKHTKICQYFEIGMKFFAILSLLRPPPPFLSCLITKYRSLLYDYQKHGKRFKISNDFCYLLQKDKRYFLKEFDSG